MDLWCVIEHIQLLLLENEESLSIAHNHDNISVFVKQAKKTFVLVFAIHSPTKCSVEEACDDFNQKAQGVDLASQRMSYYDLDRKTILWLHSFFDYLINTSVCNACVLSSSRLSQSITEFRFRLALVSQIFQLLSPQKSMQNNKFNAYYWKGFMLQCLHWKFKKKETR